MTTDAQQPFMPSRHPTLAGERAAQRRPLRRGHREGWARGGGGLQSRHCNERPTAHAEIDSNCEPCTMRQMLRDEAMQAFRDWQANASRVRY